MVKPRRAPRPSTTSASAGPGSPVRAKSKQASTDAPKCFFASITCRDALVILPSFCHAKRRSFRAVEVLHSIAIVALRPRKALTNRMSIHSEMSKFDLPVRASIPRKPRKFSFAGRFEPFRPETVELVTHGRFPSTRILPRILESSVSQSCAKKSCRTSVARFVARASPSPDCAFWM